MQTLHILHIASLLVYNSLMYVYVLIKLRTQWNKGDLVYVDDFDFIKYFAKYAYLRPFVSDSSFNLPNNLKSCLPYPHFKDENNKDPDSLRNIL